MRQTTPIVEEVIEPPIYNTVRSIIQSIITNSKEKGVKLTGQVWIESGTDTPVCMVYWGFPNGDWMTWFYHEDHFHLLALVNDTGLKHLLKVHVSQIDELERKIKEISPELGGK